ncbi:argininosuccinate lyase [Affinibrenneria salicis]|uniref:Argininosuccinate lyase n=1 Tax=Affinibrenneria salicis TaxID=2590031 RepID=A0A5J5G122_9GAMM|nr:argininosuccinate lyase [Affinibrenneria salicis]KAA9000447.1 argininosuccinate lyase [Affinibrenneria salicis]
MSDNTELLWGARFKAAPAETLTELSRSPDYYFALAPYDLAGCKAHAKELTRAGLLTDIELQAMLAAIDQLDDDYRAGKVAPIPADEDVHTFVERVLTERLGALGGKLRAGRSRNDQTVNDLRLYLRDNGRRVVSALLQLQQALVTQAEQHVNSVAPGFTHLQQAQPIVLGHQLLAHAQSFARDIERMQDWDRRSALCPLGAAALAGSAIARQPQQAADDLGYRGACENSIDAVASRDYAAEFLFVTAMLGVNLSRLCEEVCMWVSRQFRWAELHDSYATGSSIMPQKKNPDIAELTRGRSGRLVGNLTAMLTTMKAMPLSYNRDLSEDKRNVIDAVETLLVVLPAMSGMIASLQFNIAVLREQAPDGFTLATEVADWLAMRGVPFKQAHEITGRLVQLCEQENCGLSDLSDAQLLSVDRRLTADVRNALTLEAALAARSGYGGTAPERVTEQLKRLQGLMQQQSQWANEYNGPRG